MPALPTLDIGPWTAWDLEFSLEQPTRYSLQGL